MSVKRNAVRFDEDSKVPDGYSSTSERRPLQRRYLLRTSTNRTRSN
jgi:hypothetical protein